MRLTGMDRTQLPDRWGYDYKRRHFMSPYMVRSLLIAVSLPLGISLLAVIVDVLT